MDNKFFLQILYLTIYLKDQKYIEDSKEYYIDERNFMLSELKSINSIHVYDTDTNFILIRLNDKRAKEIKVELLREGNILIRDLRIYRIR